MTRPSVAILSREYPPEVYGGAGVHVEYLTRELGALTEVRVHCFGAPRSLPEVERAYRPSGGLEGSQPHLAALQTLSIDLRMAAGVEGASLVHSHTWYANFAGHLAKLMYGVPHVMTSHSLEPLRPWKAEQLGGGYAVSRFIEKTAIESADAVIAVSSGMKRDILAVYPGVEPARVHVIHNGIDLAEYRRDPGREVLTRRGIDPSLPYVVFVGRITRQKGVVHLLEAARHFTPGVPLVLCAGAPDTPEIAREVRARVDELRRERSVVWLEEMLPRHEVVQILSHARVFVCPSVYEPFGIVNLEAMACGLPVVASAVGGIPEIVVEGETGYLVPLASERADGEPSEPGAFARALSERVNRVVEAPELARRLGEAGRRRVEAHFAWSAIAGKTLELYEALTPG